MSAHSPPGGTGTPSRAPFTGRGRPHWGPPFPGFPPRLTPHPLSLGRRLQDAPQGPDRGAQVAAGLAGQRAAAVPAQEADGGRPHVCGRLPQAQQEDPLLVPPLQPHRQAPLGRSQGGFGLPSVLLRRRGLNKDCCSYVWFPSASCSLCCVLLVPGLCCCLRPELFAGSAPNNHLWHASCSPSLHLLTLTGESSTFLARLPASFQSL